LESLAEDGFWLVDRYNGLTFISYESVRFLAEWKVKEEKTDG
jgi:hypothetical protein